MFPSTPLRFSRALAAFCLVFSCARADDDRKPEAPPPYEEIGGQRFWDEEGVWAQIRAGGEKLREEDRLRTVEEVGKGFERRRVPGDVRLPAADPKPPVLSDGEVVAKLHRSVVVVAAIPEKRRGGIPYGTGFAIAPNMIVTNWHVVDGKRKKSSFVVMDWDGRVLPVSEGLAADPEGDLAILRIDDPEERIPPLPLAKTLPPPATKESQNKNSPNYYGFP